MEETTKEYIERQFQEYLTVIYGPVKFKLPPGQLKEMKQAFLAGITLGITVLDKEILAAGNDPSKEVNVISNIISICSDMAMEAAEKLAKLDPIKVTFKDNEIPSES